MTLDPKASSAFVSLGLIYMQQLKNNKRLFNYKLLISVDYVYHHGHDFNV